MPPGSYCTPIWGRPPLCEEALKRIIDVSEGYSNLEFNLDKGNAG